MRDIFFLGVDPELTEEMLDFMIECFTGFFAR